MKLPCSIVKEVLPNYVDGCIGEEAQGYVEEHLLTCEDCQKLYTDMSQPIEEKKENIDFLKKIRKNNMKRICIGIVLTLFLCMSALVIKPFVFGSATNDVTIESIRFDGENYVVLAKSNSLSKSIVDTKIVTENQRQRIVFYTVRKSCIHANTEYELIVSKTDFKEYLTIGYQVVNKEGTIYPIIVKDLTDNRVQYVGDIPRVSYLINCLLTDQTGNPLRGITVESIQLQTDQEPYEITVNLTGSIDWQEEAVASNFRAKFKALLASIDNCNIVNLKNNGKLVERIEYDKKCKTYAEVASLLSGEAS